MTFAARIRGTARWLKNQWLEIFGDIRKRKPPGGDGEVTP